MLETIRELAKKGEQYDVMEALKLLTKAFMEMCGISYSSRTVIYNAAEIWQQKLAWLDMPLSETARKCGLIDFMPYINKKFAEDEYDKYDIADMNKEELLDCCKQMVDGGEFDESTNEVLCWGLLESINRKRMPKSVTAIAEDGMAIKGSVDGQCCGLTIIYMKSPYSICVTKNKLVRDLKELLIDAYNDVSRLRSLEGDVRALYPKYQKECETIKSRNQREQFHVFDRVYNDVISDSVISTVSIKKLFEEWWGLEF